MYPRAKRKIWLAKKQHRLLQQLIPTEDVGNASETPDEQSSKYVNRPGFSLPSMTTNFRRFNGR